MRNRRIDQSSRKRSRAGSRGRSSRSDTRTRSATGSGVEDGRRVPDPSHQDFTRPGPPANPFLGVATLPDRQPLTEAGKRLRRGQNESCRATDPSSTTSCPARTPPPSTPAAKPPAFPGIATLPDNQLLLPEAGERLRPWAEPELSGYEPECHDQLPDQNATTVGSCCRAACPLPPSQSCHALAACTTLRHNVLW
ncbi:uncharacterized protein LOC125943638 [Dermacentor silvarum]|uniref:uncharacterized protein LOC125943638 n=1 Tax=Dermacentor silvarum TaxID=543639 RepID=UPI002100F3FA|nr:uncharacterized protein LOC125943638 [Dermacentor silvarum]